MKKIIPFYGIHICQKEIMSGELDFDNPMYTITVLYHAVIITLTIFKIMYLCVT